MTTPLDVRRGVLWSVATLGLATLIFVAGLAVGYRQAPPFPQMQGAYHAFRELVSGKPSAVREIMGIVFSDPLVADRVHPPITSLAGVKSANESIFIDVRRFPDAYDQLRLRGASMLRVGRSDVLKVGFELAGKAYQAYAYAVRPGWTPASRRRVGTLIIPGTGMNMASEIVDQRGTNDGPTALAAISGTDRDLFVLIKPNEDALAFHNGQAKMSLLAIKNYQLNRGGSYGASYIVQSLAITKYLQSVYDAVVVGGLSQGGAATLLNAMQSKPDAAVIASGYTALGNSLELADFNQFIIPGYWNRVAPAQLPSALAGLPTQFLFTWGEQDTPIYRLDLQTRATCRVLRPAANVSCATHAGGHEYPVPLVQQFLERKLAARAPAAR